MAGACSFAPLVRRKSTPAALISTMQFKHKAKKYSAEFQVLEPPKRMKLPETDDEKPKIDEEEWKRRVMEDLVESFSLFDIDGDGKISIHELMSVMASVGNELSPEDAEDIFSIVDTDGDGEISFEEFKECMYEKMNQETVDEDLQGAFDIFDEDRDGFISPQEVQLLFKKLGELISTDDAIEIMKECDINQDGLIDFEEFKAFYMKIFEDQPSLTDQLKADVLASEEMAIALALEEKEMAEYPPANQPSHADYK